MYLKGFIPKKKGIQTQRLVDVWWKIPTEIRFITQNKRFFHFLFQVIQLKINILLNNLCKCRDPLFPLYDFAFLFGTVNIV